MRKIACISLIIFLFFLQLKQNENRFAFECFGKQAGNANLISSNANQDLTLTATVTTQKHCKGNVKDTESVKLTLNFTYKNNSNAPIILHNNANAITGYLISFTEEDAFKGKFESKFSFHVSYHGREYDITDNFPPSEHFVIIQPKASYETKAFITLPLSTARNANVFDYLPPGKHFLMVAVDLWPRGVINRYTELKDRWKAIGVFYAQTVISRPMPFQISKDRVISDCFQ